MLRRCLLLVTASLTLATACSSGKAGEAATTTSTSAPNTPTTAPVAPTTAPPATTATTAPAPKVGYPSPRAAAEHLLGALLANDRIGAAQGASPAAVDAVFALQGKALRIYQCDTAEFVTSSCTIRATDGTGQVNMAKQPEGWAVTSLLWSPA
ncbi:MAG: hypothetical protein JWM05_2450 [Acidimicrobiales bacterium]|nr:hypothetical protein [Acidimicrobiales bacterium]